MDSKLENQLMDILMDLNRIDGVESSLISNSSGNVICHTMSSETDTSLFGPMAHVITSSSKRLLGSANQGQIERVLVESKEGKALFLRPGNVHLILLMDASANLGFVMISAKKAAKDIIELTKEIAFAEPVPEKSEIDKIIEAEDIGHEEIKEVIEKIAENEGIAEAFDKVVGSEKLDEIRESPEFESLDSKEAKEKLTEILKVKIEDEEMAPEIEVQKEVYEEIKKPESSIPVIKPPISFPKLPDTVQVPEDPEERINLVLDIYESIFLAMSIGASKIMGVSPARGLIKRFLPLEDCKTLLKGVEVKSNSSIDFDKIRENSKNIPLDKREKTLITDFSRIIRIITENYGKVMGFDAFRGMVRGEFKIINRSYGKPLEELGIKDKIHHELIDLLNNS
ncbi:MAG: roadblock/LC7 domain-containing protein [Methanobacterium sp.]|jgi:predicted regulator of Ras-like GTPase activity (Roadblock/LC7/MglB family)